MSWGAKRNPQGILLSLDPGPNAEDAISMGANLKDKRGEAVADFDTARCGWPLLQEAWRE
jgi:hypothetical protein